MRKKIISYSQIKRILAWVLVLACFVTTVSYNDVTVAADTTTSMVGVLSTTDDPHTLTRPVDTYGNSTLNAGKILVGKSVTDGINDTTGAAEPLNLTSEIYNMPAGTLAQWSPEENNFLVTVSQSAQMYGVSSKIPIPLDVVFVLDTSGSMDQPYKVNGVRPTPTSRAQDAVAAINEAINTLMSINDLNRVSVVTFSAHNSDYDNPGRTTEGNAAASVLSELAHYDGEGATNHLTWRDDRYLLGRSTRNGTRRSRNGYAGATNIQAGIALGAQQLMNAEDTQITIEGKTVTRMPFIILVSDGAPTVSSATHEWWNPDMTSFQGDYNPYAGNAFLPVMTASYYKEQISKKYYPNGDGQASFYTIGVGLDSENKDETEAMSDLARMTLDPLHQFVSTSGNQYYKEIQSYWNSYRAGSRFAVKVDSTYNQSGYYHDGNYYFYPTATTVQNPNDYQDWDEEDDTNIWVQGSRSKTDNIQESVTSLYYNDAYYDVKDSTTLTEIFRKLIIEIQKRAITDPTLVDYKWGDDFSGYVTFTDIIGEYMEVKDLTGITGNGYLYQGKSLAKLAGGYKADWEESSNTTSEQATFNAALENAVINRVSLAESGSGQAVNKETVKKLISSVVSAVSAENPYGGQIYYNSDDDYSNSFVWFGKVHYPTNGAGVTDEDYKTDFIQLAPKDADSISWINSNETTINAAKAAGANCLVRSYYVYGSADGAVESTGEYLNFSIRVIRSLEAPYEQYVSVSAPASLLAVQHVLIDDTDPNNLVAHYDALIPTRVTYEVGLRSDITADNVWSIVDEDYQKAYGNVNADGSINFFTNEFKRYENAEDAAGHTGAVHDHALTRVTFDASDTNSFYRYEKDTQLLDASGNPVTGQLVEGNTYYYRRDYYKWTASSTSREGEVPATTAYELIAVVMPTADEAAKVIYQDNGYWYIKEGTYTAATLTTGDDILKSDNETGTAHVVSHPERTGDMSNSHYTTWLGNNGKLTFIGTPAKVVMRDDPNTAVVETANIDGEVVRVGEVLTYQIHVTNGYDETVTVDIADTLPVGTELVAGSIKNGTMAADNTITWARNTVGQYDSSKNTINWSISNVQKGTTVVVSFDVLVTEGAVTTAQLTNQALVEMPEVNNKYTTNMTKNPITGKKVSTVTGTPITSDGVTVGTELEYQIAYFNDKDVAATVTITDIIPEGTTYVDDSASHVPSKINRDANNVVTGLVWELHDIAAGTGGVISFEVKVDASAVDSNLDTDTLPDVHNYATIKIGDNDPSVDTNVTITPVDTGTLVLSKEVMGTTTTDAFGLTLTEDTKKMAGTYTTTIKENGKTDQTGSVSFTKGVGSVNIKSGQTITINDLPAGIHITVTESDPGAGFTASMNPANGRVTISEDSSVTVSVTNTYSAAVAELYLGGTKVFQNNDTHEQSRTFAFELQDSDENGNVIGSRVVDLVASAELTAAAKGQASKEFKFAKLSYDKEDTYYYVLSEVDNNLSGLTYDLTKYRLKVVVEDNGKGQLVSQVYYYNTTESKWVEIAVDGTTNTINLSTLAFTNSYAPLYEELNLFGKKTLENDVLEDNQFSFIVREVIYDNDNTTVKSYEDVVTGQSKADGSIVFTTITYSQPGTHVYLIEEVTGAPNMHYGGEKYYLKVVVTEDNGKLSKKVYLGGMDKTDAGWSEVAPDASNSPTGKDTTNLTFANTYDPGYTTVTLKGTKTLNGRNLEAGEFDFVVVENGKQVAVGSNEAAFNGERGTIHFQSISYYLSDLEDTGADKRKTFTYTISEVDEKAENIQYDDTTYEVSVTVIYNDADGWSTSVSYPAGTPNTGVNFTNTFTPPPVTVIPGEVGVTVKKIIVSEHDIHSDLTFGFEAIKAAEAVNGSTVINDGYAVGDIVGTGISTSVSDGDASTFEESGVEKNKVTVDVNFTEMNFYEPGTYKCWLVEANAGSTLHGVTYSDVRYLMVIEVTQDASTGELTATTEYYLATFNGGDSKVLTNYTLNKVTELEYTNSYEAIGTLVIGAQKKLFKAGAEQNVAAGVYDFILKEKVTNGIEHTGTNDGNGNIVFDTLTFVYDGFDAEGTKELTYVMKEVPGQLHNITYDQSQYEVTIKLTYHKTTSSGNATALITGEVTQIKRIIKADGTADNEVVFSGSANGVYGKDYVVTFNNIERQGTSAEVELSKTLTGRDMKAEEFGFVMTHVDASGNRTVVDTALVGAAEAGEEAVVSMNVNFSADTIPGVYTYEIAESSNPTGGVTNDLSVYRVEINVADEHNAAGNVGSDGTLEANITTIEQIVDSTGNVITTPKQVSRITFTNVYTPEAVDVNLVGYKKLTGRDLIADEFDFVIYETGYELNGETEVIHNPIVFKETGSNDAVGNIAFTPITISKAGTYKYEIHELSNNALPGMSYADEVYKVIIVVKDNLNGELIVDSVKVDNGEELSEYDASLTGENAQIVFENNYDAEDTRLKLQGTKKLTGRDMEAGEFTFHVNLIEYIDDSGNSTDYSSQPIREAVGYNTEAKENVEAAIEFTTLNYSQTGTYIYKVSEVKTEANNVTIVAGNQGVTIVVKVVDNNGKLEANVDSNNSETIAFVNEYKPNPTTAVIQAQKSLSGKPLNADEFTFRLTEVSRPDGATATVPAGSGYLEVRNAADGSIVFENETTTAFDELTFTRGGEYKYQLTEVYDADNDSKDDNPNMGYDKTVYNVTVNVTDDGNGKLTATVSYPDITQGIPTFSNAYTPSEYPVTVETLMKVSGGKELIGREMLAGEFKFVIKDIQNVPVAEGSNDANGNIVFDYDLNTAGVQNGLNDGIKFKHAGVFRYSISEVFGSDAAITYDSAVWYIQIEVVQDSVTGKLHLSDNGLSIIEVDNSTSDPAEGIVFTNSYNPVDAEVNLTGHKFMTGNRTDVKEDEFTFHLIDKVTGEIAAKGTTDASGKIIFEKMTFDKVDTKEYTLVEVRGDAVGVQYNINNDSYDVKIVVTESMIDTSAGEQFAGILQAAVTIDGVPYDANKTGENAQIQFTNYYHGLPATAVISAVKEIDGRPLNVNDKFAFKLTPASGNPVELKAMYAANNVDGDITFNVENLSKAGTYRFTITEEAGNDKSIKYSEESVDVSVVVADNMAGNLYVKEIYYETGSVPAFINVYTPDPSAIFIDAAKQLSGRALADGEFRFVIKDETGKELTTGTNAADGKIYFTEFTLPEGNDHKLYVSEVDTAVQHVLYDGATYMVLVDVTNDGTGILKATVEYPDGDIVFKNEYKEPSVPGSDPEPQPDTIMTSFAFNATKVLTGRIMAAGEFQFQVKDSKGEVVATGINEANGSIQFSPLVVFTPGRHVYTVSEVKGGALDITYDTKVYTVTVDVEQVGDDLAATINYPKGGLTFRNYFGDTTPRTGDATPIGLLIALVLISGAGVAGLLIFKRKKK